MSCFLTHGVESFIQLESIDSVNLRRPHLDHISQNIHVKVSQNSEK